MDGFRKVILSVLGIDTTCRNSTIFVYLFFFLVTGINTNNQMEVSIFVIARKLVN